MKASKWSVLLLAVFVLCAAPTFAADQKGPRGLVTLGGGVVRGNADYPGKHVSLGGGGYVYLFYKQNKVARRFAVGVEISRAVLGTSGEFEYNDGYSYAGPARIQAQALFLSPQMRFDLAPTNWKYVRVAVHGGYNGIREKLALQFIDPYQYGKHWVGVGNLASQWSGAASYGLSVAFAMPNRKYNDKVVGTSWAFPLRYTRLTNGMTDVRFGLERYF